MEVSEEESVTGLDGDNHSTRTTVLLCSAAQWRTVL